MKENMYTLTIEMYCREMLYEILFYEIDFSFYFLSRDQNSMFISI